MHLPALIKTGTGQCKSNAVEANAIGSVDATLCLLYYGQFQSAIKGLRKVFMKKCFSFRCKAVLLFAVFAWCMGVSSLAAQAATLVVTNTLNTGAGSLRQAITGANAVAGDDTIIFDLPGAGPHVINLTEALPALNSNIAIVNDRPGDEDVTVRRSATATASFRIFLIQPGAVVTISGITIGNGELVSVSGSSLGGGVRNDGTLTLRDCTLTSNNAVGGTTSTGAGGTGQGGALYNSGTLTVTDCIFSGNVAGGGPGNGGQRGGAGQGGGLYSNGGTVTLIGCAFANNSASGGFGGTGGVGQGGAVRSDGNITMTNCALNANTAGSTQGDGQGGGIFNSGTISLAGCSLSGNAAFSNNGGVGQGGGIRSDGTLNLTNSTLLGNEARGGDNVNQAGPGVGGGIYNSGASTIRGSTLESNLALGGNSDGAEGGAGLGGGLYNGSSDTATINLTNSTLSGNRAVAGSSGGGQTAASLGGGLYMQGATGGAGGTATIIGATIAYNQAEDGSGISVAGGTVNLNNSIVANNSATGSGPSQRDVRGFLSESSQYNIIGDGSSLINLTNGVNGNQIGTAASPIDPLLGPLQNNGGPTETHALLPGSPALDKGNSFNLTTDQRGIRRPYDDPAIANAPGGDGSDIGAFEVRPATANPLTLSINDITITEGNTGGTQATFTVTLSGASDQTVTVQANTTNGIAKAPADYTATATTLTFTPGQTSRTITVPVAGDLLDETDEGFYVFLSAPSNAELGKARGVATILDDDDQPTISIEDLSIGEGNSGQRVAVVRLTLSAPSGKVVRVNYATSNGTAVGGNDYVAVASTQVAFNVGQTVAFARVLINGDLLPEANETVLVSLSAPLNATLADNQGVVTILNDDSPPALTINDVQITEGNSGTKNLTFTVSLSKATGQTVTVNYATANGIAQATSDYVAQSGSLTFAPGGPLTRTISIIINGDTQVEGNETLYVLLSGATNASIGRARGAGTIQNDDPSSG